MESEHTKLLKKMTIQENTMKHINKARNFIPNEGMIDNFKQKQNEKTKFNKVKVVS